MLRQLRIPDEILIQIDESVQSALPNEACGLLGGKNDLAQAFLPMTNELHSPVAFYMSPEEQLKAFLFFEEQLMDLLAIFHSHPDGPRGPSPTDIHQFYYPGTLYLIWSPASDKNHLHGFQILPEGIQEIPIRIEMSRND